MEFILLRVTGATRLSTGGPVTLSGIQKTLASREARSSKFLLEVQKFKQILKSRLKSRQTQHAGGGQDTK